jgi:DNA-binding CsgD family transcriptional regulator/tetratricopeptide (TPR) repeat protein
MSADAQLLERSVELDVLRELLAFVRSTGRGHLVLLAGEAGVGKTALVQAFADSVEQFRVLSGACEALETPRPLGPIADIAAEVGGDLAAVVDAGATPPDVLGALVDELRRRTPSIVVLEDLHWSDAATLDLLRLLARRVATVPALVIATYRDDSLVRHHPLRVALGELSPVALTRLTLEPLSPGSVTALARPYGVDGLQLHARTGGNPFYVTEALATSGTTMPDSVRDAVLARAARLSTPAQRLLDGVAIAPPRIELWLLERLAGADLQFLEECLASGMLQAHGPTVAFRHEIARVAVADALPPDRALALHRAALVALAEAGKTDPARLAHHAEAAGDGDAVLRFASAAAERAAVHGAHREAAAQYARALRFAHVLPSAQRADLLERRSYEAYLTAAIDEAIESREQALEERRACGDRLGEGSARRWLSRLWWYAGHRGNAEREALAAVEILEELEPGPELAMAYSTVSQLHMLAGDVAATREWGERAIALGKRLGFAQAVVHSLNNIGTAEHTRGASTGVELLERSLRLAREAGLEEEVTRAHTNLAVSAIQSRSYKLVARYLEAGIAHATEHEFDSHLLYLLGWKARAELDLGRWEAAEETARNVVDDPLAAPPSRIAPLIVLGLIRARTGNGDPWELLDEASTLAEDTGEVQRIGGVAAARAEARWLGGDSDAVGPETDAALTLALERDDAWFAGDLVAWRHRAGLAVDVRPTRCPEPIRLELDGRPRAASARWRKLGCPYEAAVALLAVSDEPSLRSSLEAFQALGARPAAARAARLLREQGVRGVARGPRASTRRNPAGLTQRELEVLALVAEGMRNAHIAERLVVSAKTVDHHVSAILRKLNVDTRTEAAAHASRLGLLER